MVKVPSHLFINIEYHGLSSKLLMHSWSEECYKCLGQYALNNINMGHTTRLSWPAWFSTFKGVNCKCGAGSIIPWYLLNQNVNFIMRLWFSLLKEMIFVGLHLSDIARLLHAWIQIVVCGRSCRQLEPAFSYKMIIINTVLHYLLHLFCYCYTYLRTFLPNMN